MGLSSSILLINLLFSGCWATLCKSTPGSSTMISVLNGGPWGYWGNEEFCKNGYATGFSLKIEPYQGGGMDDDDTSLNGIRLICSDGSFITSSFAKWGTWSGRYFCQNSGKLMAFSLRVELPQGVGDDTAANNIKFLCEEGQVLEGDAHKWGDFGPWSETCKNGVCGIHTKVEAEQGPFDDTALNDVILCCCGDK